MKKKILVIEDDNKLVFNLKLFLESSGFIIETARDGKTGILKVKEFKPDLIICDISLPQKDGYQVLQELQLNKLTKRIPFIFLTAKVEREDLRKGMHLGADDYIFKPFDLDDLLNSIKLRIEKLDLTINSKTDNISNSTKIYNLHDKLLIPKGNKMNFVEINNIKYIKSESPYVRLTFTNGKSTLFRETIKDWENKLPQNYFIRIHRTTIINTAFITKIEKSSNASLFVLLKEESEPFVISKRFSSKIKKRYS